MHTLEQLRRGELAGLRRLDLAADLTEFPNEIFPLADSPEVLQPFRQPAVPPARMTCPP